jgi:hypothetical protein
MARASSVNFPIQLGLQLGPIRATWLIEAANWALFLNSNKGWSTLRGCVNPFRVFFSTLLGCVEPALDELKVFFGVAEAERGNRLVAAVASLLKDVFSRQVVYPTQVYC